ncbi:MAG: reprolysin-like metallopeptidase [Flavobacteriaceae bacterium]
MEHQYQYVGSNISHKASSNFKGLNRITTLVFLFFTIQWLVAQSYWTHQSHAPNAVQGTYYDLDPSFFDSYSPSVSIQQKAKEPTILFLPNESGVTEAFLLKAVPTMAAAVAKKAPHVQTYMGWSTEREGVVARITLSPQGVNAWIQTPEGAHYFVQPDKRKNHRHLVYERQRAFISAAFQCSTPLANRTKSPQQFVNKKSSNKQVNLKTFRIAIATTGEFTAYWDDGDDGNGSAQEDAFAAVVATLNRINQVFETDLGIRLELVSGSELMMPNASTDSFTGNFNGEAQAFFTEVVGEANYDVGHLLGYGEADGNSGCIACVCKTNQKGQGYTIHPFETFDGSPFLNDYFDLDYVAHELGHQFGAYHSFSYLNEGTGSNVEPGSGTTIMGYAGLVGPDNVQAHGDPYFHYVSIASIQDFLNTSSCYVPQPLTNTPPSVSAGNDYTIPKGTAYVLQATASDPDEEELYYCWEQLDTGEIGSSEFGPQNASGAQARSLPPRIESTRHIPQWDRILLGELIETEPKLNSDWETVPTVGRTLQWGVTVRDRQSVASGQGGLVDQDRMRITVLDQAGPFRVLSQSEPIVWQSGQAEWIRWDSAETNRIPINTQSVTIVLSPDGSENFTHTLQQETPNDGEALVVVPSGINTENARIKIMPIDNIFFAVNEAPITILNQSHQLVLDQYEAERCQPDRFEVPYTLIYDQETQLSFVDLPEGITGSFSVPLLNESDSKGILSLSTENAQSFERENIIIRAQSGNVVSEFNLYFRVFSNALEAPVLQEPANGSEEISVSHALEWESNANASTYIVEWSSTNDFSNAVSQTVTQEPRLSNVNWTPGTEYYWRVRSRNVCGESVFSEPYVFQTAAVNCLNYTAGDLPILLEDANFQNVGYTEASIAITETNLISDLNVRLTIQHTYLQDLTLRLRAPDGTTVVLAENNGGKFDNFTQTFFDQQAATSITTGSAPFSGSFRPIGDLSKVVGKSIFGVWKLQIIDSEIEDSGSLLEFEIQACLEGAIEINSDADAIADRMDNCPEVTNPAQEDFDGDGIGDLCDINSPNNFTIRKYDTSCRDKNNGRLEIDPLADFSYQLEILGPNGYERNQSFTNNGLRLSNLASGAYSICITSPDAPTFELCYTASIGSPAPLSVTTEILTAQNKVQLNLSGAPEYRIDLNAKRYTVSNQNQVELPLEEGVNELHVASADGCQLAYHERLYWAQKSMLYPNPTQGIIEVLVGGQTPSVRVLITPMSGEIWYHKTHRLHSDNRKVVLDLSGYPAGVYLVRLQHAEGTESLKVLVQ